MKWGNEWVAILQGAFLMNASWPFRIIKCCDRSGSKPVQAVPGSAVTPTGQERNQTGSRKKILLEKAICIHGREAKVIYPTDSFSQVARMNPNLVSVTVTPRLLQANVKSLNLINHKLQQQIWKLIWKKADKHASIVMCLLISPRKDVRSLNVWTFFSPPMKGNSGIQSDKDS